MRLRLVPFLACPDCGGDLVLTRGSAEGEHVVEGELACGGCRRAFPITRGVPRLTPLGLGALDAEVAESFGWEWNRFDELRPEYLRQFLDWVQPLSPEDFRGRRVLEGGCGKGRHSVAVAGFGARDVFAVDLGSAVEAAFRNTRDLEAVHVIQADITHLPLKRCAEVAFSVGVLHHLPDPQPGFRGLIDKLEPGGRIAVWVYGREGNEWIVDFVDPLRTRVTSRAPRRLLYELARPLGWAIAAASKGVYAPLQQVPALHERLFYREYLTYIARLPVREIHSIVFDHLVTPVAHYLRRDEVAAWFADPRLEQVAIDRHNGNSWRGQARLAARAAGGA